MRTLLMSVTLASVLLLGIRCCSQTASPQATITSTQNAAADATRIGNTCVFMGSEINSYPNCVLRDGEGKRYIAPNYARELRFDSRGLAAVFNDDHQRYGWMYVDRKGRVIVQGVPIVDNWAWVICEECGHILPDG